MAEILERGSPPSEWKYIGQCGVCQSKIRFDADEVQEDDGEFSAECEVCESKMGVVREVPAENQAKHWRDQ